MFAAFADDEGTFQLVADGGRVAAVQGVDAL